jgi:glucose/arabinose dehydrogenase
VTERNGTVSRIDPETGERKVILTLADVREVGESGLLGLALHPGFADTPQVFLVYTYGSSTLREKLVRYTYNGTSLVDPVTLIQDIPASSTHDGSRLRVLPDRTLLMTTGDAQISAAPQSHTSLNGKILRLRFDGSAPGDNPEAGAPYPANLVWTTGHRNPQGLAPGPDGIVYSSEHGPTSDDEINIVMKGRNYGWPNVAGFCDNVTSPNEKSFCQDSSVVEPIKAWSPTIAPAGTGYYAATMPIAPFLHSLLVSTV